MGWLCELDQKKGLDIGTTYHNEQAAAVFTDFIGEDVYKNVFSSLEKTGKRFYSLTMDGTTDAATVEQESVFIRAAGKGEVR